ncbi:hypothetical protein [Nocardiopsis sp. CC223A]|uniref:hypothetical protein n=1 Tax=Nocardiopsis sp. CC223A TaxID=3044051 RepID=UPI00278BB148|nr:hypothetical protein [Nocardiopsis sp. CC223A]
MATKTSIPDDLQRLIRHIPEADEEERARAQDAAGAFLAGLPQGALSSLLP